MASGPNQWCTIESDPGVFTSLIESFGVRNAEFSELWSLDDDSLRSLVESSGKVHGLIFLFKWQSDRKSEDAAAVGSKGPEPLTGEDVPADLFFAKQVTHNACATQAILSVLLNASDAVVDETASAEKESKDGDDEGCVPSSSKLVLGPTLTSLRSFTLTFPPDLRGEAISASEEIRTAHNSFARKDAFLTEEKKARIASDDDDVFHFVAYVPHGNEGKVYELDGLKAGPIEIGTCDTTAKSAAGAEAKDVGEKGESDFDDMAWLGVARKAIQDRIELYAAEEIKFNLMAVVRDKRCALNEKLAALKTAGVDDDDEHVLMAKASLAAEEEKRKDWDMENARRRHNYLPFCVELIRALAGSGKLPELTTKANKRMMENRQKAIAARMAKKAK